jgi:myosin heavy subunit
MFAELKTAFGTMGVTQSQLDSLFTGISAVLNAGQIKFENESTSAGDAAIIANMDVMTNVATLLGIDPPELEKSLREKTLVTSAKRGSVYYVKRDATAAKFAADAMAKSIYNNLFDWVVNKVAVSLGYINEPLPFVAVLDIFGFESFDVNGFEQLLINYANESLQSVFNRAVFISEQQLYKEEGIDVEAIDAPDNSHALTLIGSKTGLLNLLDQAGSMPQPSDEKWNELLHKEHKDSRCFPRPHAKDIRDIFIISHYAAEVTYTVGTFLEKNNDTTPVEVEALMTDCGCEVVREIFVKAAKDKEDAEKEPEGEAGAPARGPRRRGGAKKKKKQTVANVFTEQMGSLKNNLEATRCSFILCIKPNFAMNLGVFDRPFVMDQLQCTGTVQTCEVLRVGLPTRVAYAELGAGFKKALPESTLAMLEKGVDDRALVQGILWAFSVDTSAYALGKTRLFFKTGKIAVLEDLLKILAKCVESGDSEQIDFLNKRLKFFIIRRRWRKAYAFTLAENAWKWLFAIFRKQNSAKIIQRGFRCSQARHKFKTLKEAEAIRKAAEDKTMVALAETKAAAAEAAAAAAPATAAAAAAKAAATDASGAAGEAEPLEAAAKGAASSDAATAEVGKITALVAKAKASADAAGTQKAAAEAAASATAAATEKALAASQAATAACEEVETASRNMKGREAARTAKQEAIDAHKSSTESSGAALNAVSECDKSIAECNSAAAKTESLEKSAASAAANKAADEMAAKDAEKAAELKALAAKADEERLAAEAEASAQAAAEQAANAKAAEEDAARQKVAAEEQAAREAEAAAANAKAEAEEADERAKAEEARLKAEQEAAEQKAMDELEAAGEEGEGGDDEEEGGGGGEEQGGESAGAEAAFGSIAAGASKKKKKKSEPSQAELEKQQQEAEMAELREFWTILLRGLVVMKYATTGSKPQERVLWLDRSGARLYLDHRKRFDSKGNEKGLYLRDISQVRPGCNTQAFLKSRAHAPPTEKCFSLIGTERTLDMEMPTAFVRDRVVAKFNLLLKALSPVSPRKLTGEDASLMAHFQEVLIRGMEVVAHTSSSFSQHKTTKNVLWLGDGVNVNGETAAKLYLANKKRKSSKGTEKGLWLEDMAECRPGINSDVFFKAPDNVTQAIANKCFSVIGSECTLDLEVKSGEARNAVVHRFQLWLQQIAQSNPRHFSNQ